MRQRKKIKELLKRIVAIALAFVMITSGTFGNGNVKFVKAANEYKIYISRKVTMFVQANNPLSKMAQTNSGDYTIYSTNNSMLYCGAVNNFSFKQSGPGGESVVYKYGSSKIMASSKDDWASKITKNYNDYPVAYVDVSGSPHNYSSSVIQSQSCTNAEVTKYTCAYCGDSYTSTTANALGHAYSGSVIQSQTCTNNEITRYTCSRCGTYYDSTTANATGQHSYTVFQEGANCQHPAVYRCSKIGRASCRERV